MAAGEEIDKYDLVLCRFGDVHAQKSVRYADEIFLEEVEVWLAIFGEEFQRLETPPH